MMVVEETRPCPWFYGSDHPEEFLDWIGAIEEYFNTKKYSEDKKFSLAVLNLRQNACQLWRTRGNQQLLEKKKRGTIWERLKKLMKDRFLPPTYRSNWCFNNIEAKGIHPQENVKEDELINNKVIIMETCANEKSHAIDISTSGAAGWRLQKSSMDLDFVGKVMCLPSRCAVHDIESPTNNWNNIKTNVIDDVDNVKQEPSLDFLDRSKNSRRKVDELCNIEKVKETKLDLETHSRIIPESVIDVPCDDHCNDEVHPLQTINGHDTTVEMNGGLSSNQDHMSNKRYVGKADFMVFRTQNQLEFLGQSQEKKLCAVIQLASQQYPTNPVS